MIIRRCRLGMVVACALPKHCRNFSQAAALPPTTENYSPQLQRSQQRLAIQQLRRGDRRMRQRELSTDQFLNTGDDSLASCILPVFFK